MPSIEAAISEEPALLMQLIGMVYRRKDEGKDPAEWEIPNEERRKAAAMTAYGILRRTSRTPGTNKDGAIEASALRRWVDEVRRLGKAIWEVRNYRSRHR